MDRRSIGKKRLDAFVDGAFAFSATLLAVGNNPAMQSFDDVTARFAHVPAFALSLLVILSFWWAHRQFGTLVINDDAVSNAISIFIMFIVMIFVFPLSFLSEAFLHWLSDGVLPGRGLNASEMRGIYLLFGGGYGLMSTAYILMYWHAISSRIRLRVPSALIPATKHRMRNWMWCVLAALASIILSNIAPIERLIWFPMLPYLVLILYLIGDAILLALRRRKHQRRAT